MLEYSSRVEVTDAERLEYLAFAERVAAEAGAFTLQYFRAGVDVENKLEGGRFDPVTEADRGAEQIIRRAIEAQYPQHGIFGEEFGFKAGDGLTWVIDPIDGTRAFMTGMVHWGVLLALFDGESPVVGVMYQPFTQELFSGDCRQAHFRQGDVHRPLAVRGCASLDKAVVASTGPQWFTTPPLRAGFERLVDATLFTRYGGDCYLYGMLAMGFVDLATDASLNAYDIQALIPIIRGAGGVVTTWDGGNPSMGGAVLASGDALVHAQALEVLSASG